MKRITIIGIIIISSLIITCKPKSKLPGIPEFNFLNIDSTTIFNTKNIPEGKPIVIVYFSPNCDLCQKETKDLITNIEDLKNVRFYFLSNDSFDSLRRFNEVYEIYKYPNIQLGFDYQFKFIQLFKPTGTPYFLIFDRNKELRTVVPGGTKSKKLLDLLKPNDAL